MAAISTRATTSSSSSFPQIEPEGLSRWKESGVVSSISRRSSVMSPLLSTRETNDDGNLVARS